MQLCNFFYNTSKGYGLIQLTFLYSRHLLLSFFLLSAHKHGQKPGFVSVAHHWASSRNILVLIKQVLEGLSSTLAVFMSPRTETLRWCETSSHSSSKTAPRSCRKVRSSICLPAMSDISHLFVYHGRSLVDSGRTAQFSTSRTRSENLKKTDSFVFCWCSLCWLQMAPALLNLYLPTWERQQTGKWGKQGFFTTLPHTRPRSGTKTANRTTEKIYCQIHVF